MPFGSIWTCNNCHYEVTVSGMWDYYIDENGTRKRCAHLSRSAEAQKSLITGCSVEWYCPTCRSVRDVPVLEFDKSKNSPLPALSDHYDKSGVEDVPVLCDKCGSEMSEDLDGLPCPKCGKGKFKESGRFMS